MESIYSVFKNRTAKMKMATGTCQRDKQKRNTVETDEDQKAKKMVGKLSQIFLHQMQQFGERTQKIIQDSEKRISRVVTEIFKNLRKEFRRTFKKCVKQNYLDY